MAINFVYRGVDSHNAICSGIISAQSKSDAIYKLSEDGINVLFLKKQKAARGPMVFLSRRDLIAFFVHIGEMDKAGMRTGHSLDLLIDLADSKSLIKVAKLLRQRVYEGMTLSDAMAMFGCFGDMFPNLIFVAEKTNSVYKVSHMIVEYIKWTAELKRQIRSAIMKPLIGLGIILLIIVIMSIFVMPKLMGVLGDLNKGQTPGYTLAFVAFAGFIRSYWFFIPLIIGTFAAINKFPKLLGAEKMARFVDHVKLYMPIFGKLFIKIEIARLASFFAILVQAGYKANEALLLSPKVIVNKYVKYCVEGVGTVMSNGDTMHAAFSKFAVFPKFFVSMIGIGEKVNDVEGTIVNIKESYDKEVNFTVEFVINAMKPIVTIVTGAVIGWMAMSVFGPMYGSIVNLSEGGIK